MPSRSSIASSATTTRTGSPPARACPRPAGSRRAAWPPSASTRSARPRSPEPPPGRRRRCRRRRPRRRARRRRARPRRWRSTPRAYLATFVSALGHEVVGRDLDRRRAGGPRARRASATGTGARAASDSSATASPWSVSTAGWMPCASSRSSFSDARQLLARAGQQPLRLGVGRELRRDEPQPERQRDEPLLGAVVQVALEPAALGVAGLDDPRARALQLVQAGAQLGLQARVLERDRGRGGDRVEQLGLVARAPGRAAARRRARRRGRSASSPGRRPAPRSSTGCALQVRPALVLRQPVHERRATDRAARGPARRAARRAPGSRAARRRDRRRRRAPGARAAARPGSDRREPEHEQRRAPDPLERACPLTRPNAAERYSTASITSATAKESTSSATAAARGRPARRRRGRARRSPRARSRPAPRAGPAAACTPRPGSGQQRNRLSGPKPPSARPTSCAPKAVT